MGNRADEYREYIQQAQEWRRIADHHAAVGETAQAKRAQQYVRGCEREADRVRKAILSDDEYDTLEEEAGDDE